MGRSGIIRSMKIEHVPVEAALMMTFGPEHPCWADPLKMPDVTGYFVRLDPPANCPDEDVIRMRAQALDLGAAAVKVERLRRDGVLHGEAFAAPPAERPHLSARKVVAEMLAESRSAQKDALAALVNETLTQEGL